MAPPLDPTKRSARAPSGWPRSPTRTCSVSRRWTARPSAAATTSRGVATPITRLRRLRARPHSEELEEVVSQTDQRPLGGDFVIAAEGEAPKGAALLRLTKDRLDDRLAARVDPPARRRTQLLAHPVRDRAPRPRCRRRDRKSTRLNSSHLVISYAVFCLKKK